MKVSAVPSRLAALTLCGLLALTGCSSSSESAAPDAASGGSDELAAVQAFAALPRAEQEQELRALTASMDRQLMTMSGLEAELGGPAQADTAYAAVSAGILDLAQGFVDQPDFGRFGARVVTEDAPSMGGLMFGNLMIAALAQDAAVSSTNDIPPGKPATETKDMSDPASGGEGAMKVTGDAAKGSLDVGGTVTVGGVTGTLKTLITVAPCPDAKGQFTSTTTMTASVTSAGGSTGSNLTVEVTIVGQVDDDAQLVSYDVDTRTQSAEFANSKGMYADQSVGWSVGGSGWSDYRAKVNRTGGKVTDAFVAEQGKWGQLMAVATMDKAVEAAKKGWESGRCVTLEPTTAPGKRTGLKPSAPVTITAPPRSKIDGTAVGGTVTATLNGDSSVDPSGSKVPADATLAYVAPGEKDKSATVSLEARSKRGVAKASVAFDTKAGGYALEGSIATAPAGTQITGATCDVTKPFTAESTGDMVGTIIFTPTSDVAGTLRFTGRVGNAPLKITGKGKYTVNIPEGADAGTLDWTWSVTTYTPLGNRTGSGPVTLAMTPSATC